MWNCARFSGLAMSQSADVLSSAPTADLGRQPPAPDYDDAPRDNSGGLYSGGFIATREEA